MFKRRWRQMKRLLLKTFPRSWVLHLLWISSTCQLFSTCFPPSKEPNSQMKTTTIFIKKLWITLTKLLLITSLASFTRPLLKTTWCNRQWPFRICLIIVRREKVWSLRHLSWIFLLKKISLVTILNLKESWYSKQMMTRICWMRSRTYR